LRPETAQAIFVQFKNVLETSRQKVPFGVAQVGKAFARGEPAQFHLSLARVRADELEFFIKPDEAIAAIHGSVTTPGGPVIRASRSRLGWQIWHQYWVEERLRFYESIGRRERLWSSIGKSRRNWRTTRAPRGHFYKFPFSKRDDKAN